MTRFFFFYNSLAGRVQSRHVNCFEFWTYSSCVDLSFRCDTWVRTCGVLDVVSLAEVTADTAEHETNPFSHFIQSRQSDQPFALFSEPLLGERKQAGVRNIRSASWIVSVTTEPKRTYGTD